MTTAQDDRSPVRSPSRGPVELRGHAPADPRDLRDSLGHYASGVTIITGRDRGGPVGFTCQSFYSVSLEPPLVSFSVMRASTSYPRIRESGRFCVNILAEDQHELSNSFARRGVDKWAGIDWDITAAGNPVLRDTLLWIDCEAQDEHEAGDHYIVVGRVVELGAADWRERHPLVFFKGAYGQLQSSGR